MSKATLRTFIAYVEDLPGVLNRITSLFRRRNYNIVSLTVGRTERPGVSRMTIVARGGRRRGAPHRGQPLQARQRPLGGGHQPGARRMVRELALIKVRADATTRGEVMRLCEVFRARVVDVGPRRSSRDHRRRRQDRRPGRRAAPVRARRDGAHRRRRDGAQRRSDRRVGPHPAQRPAPAADSDDASAVGRREGGVSGL